MSDYTVKYPFIKIRKIDELFSKHQKQYNEMISSQMDAEEKKKLKLHNNKLKKDLAHIETVIHQTLDLLESNGCDVYKYIDPYAKKTKTKETALDKEYAKAEQRNVV